MKPIKLYRYTRPDGGVTVSPENPDVEYQECVRLVAGEGKLLTNGNIQISCIDTDSVDGWWEIDAPIETDEKITAS